MSKNNRTKHIIKISDSESIKMSKKDTNIRFVRIENNAVTETVDIEESKLTELVGQICKFLMDVK